MVHRSATGQFWEEPTGLHEVTSGKMKGKTKKVIDPRTGPPPMEPNKSYVNPGDDDQMEIEGYKLHKCRQILTWIAIALTLGFLRLIFHWKPEWMIAATHVRCSLEEADTVILKDGYKQVFVARVKVMTVDGVGVEVKCRVDQDVTTLIRYFSLKRLKFIWNGGSQSFIKLKGLGEGQTCRYFHMIEASGQTQLEMSRRSVLYGSNSMPLHVTPVIKLLFKEIINPFYVFQIFSCILWYIDEYAIYASCIVLESLVSLSVAVYQTRRMLRALRNTIHVTSIVSVQRESGFVDMMSDVLVPGDVIEVPRDGCIMQCDAVLLSGNCIVNEGMLTGESVPVTKTPLPNSGSSGDQSSPPFNMKEHSKHVLFCGTKVIQTRYYGNQMVKAVVLRTGFMTAKGELVRAILFPKPLDFRFYQDTMKFVAFLACIAGAGFIFTIVLMSVRGLGAGHIILRSLDVITIAVNPALPAAMTIGVVFAMNRLKRAKVYCISPSHINICGTVNVACFDKTGTLTEDGLDMWGVVPVENNRFLPPQQDMSQLTLDHFLYTMACCHSLTIIEGELCGDPLDLKMVEATNWEVEEPGEDTSRFDVIMPTVVRPRRPDIVPSTDSNATQDKDSMGSEVPSIEIGVVRQFTFSSNLQRMSVITRILSDNHYNIYAKGAPETIVSLCLEESVPDDFHDVLMHYTQQGYRVIALAWKPLKLSYLKVQRVERKEVENDLNFLGLLIMENRLKPETTPIIKTLKQADIRTVMVTGDNILTAVSVAVDCDMVGNRERVILVNVLPPIDDNPASVEFVYADDNKRVNIEDMEPLSTKDSIVMLELPPPPEHKYHFAVTGKSWADLRQYFPQLIPKLVVRGTVFARMSPEQKAQLIEALQEIGYYVGMCGDGANDCGALRAAHTGISLSEAEASLASPFTSKEANIKCIPTVIREGRGALVTSFGVFKFLGCASFVQFITVMLLYWINANMTDLEFLFVDLILVSTLSITFGYTEAYPKLVKEPPTVKLASIGPILSILFHTVVVMLVQVQAFFIVREQPWFEIFDVNNKGDSYASHENAVVFITSCFQYILLGVVFSNGAPYRKPFFTNWLLMLNLITILGLTLFIAIYPTDGFAKFLELKPVPSMLYRILTIGVALMNFVVCLLVQMYVLDNVAVKRWFRQACKKKQTKNPYQAIENELTADPDWPPISQSSTSLAGFTSQEFVPKDKVSVKDLNDMEFFPQNEKSPDLEVAIRRRSPAQTRQNELETEDVPQEGIALGEYATESPSQSEADQDGCNTDGPGDDHTYSTQL